MDLKTFGRNIGEVLADRSLQLVRSTSMDEIQRLVRGRPAPSTGASTMASVAIGLGVFTLGAAVGAGLTALYTPTTGPELRKQITRGARDARKQAKQLANEVGSDVRHRFDDARTSLGDELQMMAGGRRAKRSTSRKALNGQSKKRSSTKRTTAASAEA